MKINISTPIYPTEDSDKIKKALQKIFPQAKFKTTKNKISLQTTNIEVLSKIRDIVEQKRIQATLRYLLLEHGKLQLNKQTAMIGKINFVEEEYALGNINIEGNVDEILNYLAPTT